MSDAPEIRDRVVEMRRVPASELEDNDRNWRTHPFAQVQAMGEILDRIGIAGTLLAYHSERNGGKLTLIDGHERKSNHQTDWPTVILDVTDEEADQLLATHDPLGAMAEANKDKLRDLLDGMRVDGPALSNMLHRLRIDSHANDGTADRDPTTGPPEMELLPFEHYDLVTLICKTSQDWLALVDVLGIKNVKFTLKDGKRVKVGRGRVIDAAKVLPLLKAGREALQNK